MDEENAPGWDAIEEAVGEHLAVDGETQHWSTGVLPGQDGVYGISAYRVPGLWLFVTFGLTELYDKESEDADVSGWGFELTMRVPRGDDDQQPPQWPLTLLAQLGEYVYSSGSPFGPGHRLDPGGPITGSPDTRLTAVAFAADPELPSLRTTNGSVDFLQVVGITHDELEQMKQSSTAAVLEQLSGQAPRLETDPSR